jgi:hypothetical protein
MKATKHEFSFGNSMRQFPFYGWPISPGWSAFEKQQFFASTALTVSTSTFIQLDNEWSLTFMTSTFHN